MSFTSRPSASASGLIDYQQLDRKELNENVLKKDTIRRTLPADLTQLQKELAELSTRFQDGFQDALTKKLLVWVHSFRLACTEKDLDAVKTRFIKELQALLKDPLPFDEGSYLDENALLGSDGTTYCSMTYGIFLTVPNEFRNRSPLNPMLPALFTVRPHEPVKKIMSWLKVKLKLDNPFPIRPRTEQLYAKLLKEDKIPRLPVSTSANAGSAASAAGQSAFKVTLVPSSTSQKTQEKLKKFLAEQAAVKKRKEDHSINLKERDADLEHLRQRLMKGAAELKDNADARGNNIGQWFQQQMSEVNRLQNEFRQQEEEVKQRIDNLERDVPVLQSNLENLQKQQAQLHSSIKNVAQQSSKLAEQIEATRKAIEEKESKAERLKRVLKAVAIVGVCIFATWALGVALEGTAFGAMIGPTSGGGLQFGGTFIF